MDAAINTISVGQSPNIRKTDIILELAARDGGAKAVTGLIDRRLFTKENELHAIMNPETCLWRLRYKTGVVPPALQQQFTSFSKCLNFVETYFGGRNVDVVKIID